MERDIYKKAEKRVKQKKGFFVHFSVYISMGIFFFAMNMLTDPNDIWFMFPLLPWGGGLLIHYLTTFGLPGTKILSEEWEQAELEKEIQRLQALKNLEGKKSSFGTDIPQRRTERGEERLDLDDLKKIKEKQKDPRWDDQDLV